jgi:hypothetical protein
MFGFAARFRPCSDVRRIDSTGVTGAKIVGPNPEEQERQAAMSQALRRDVNERRLEGAEDAVVEFVCECSDPACEELVSLTVAECEFVRRVPNRLVVKVGHTNHDSERVLIEEPGRFQVLEKFGPGEDVVAHLDPRGPNRRRRAAVRQRRR